MDDIYRFVSPIAPRIVHDCRDGGWCESFVAIGWGLVFFFWCSLSLCRTIVSINALYFLVCWVWLSGLKGSLHILFCRCWLLSPLPLFAGCVFAFLDNKDLCCVVLLGLIPLLLIEVLWCLERVGFILHFLLSHWFAFGLFRSVLHNPQPTQAKCRTGRASPHILKM